MKSFFAKFTGIEKMYILFCAANGLWILAFSAFGLFGAARASLILTGGFLLLNGALFLMYAAFGTHAREKGELQKWLYIGAVIIIGLILRIIAREIFRTEQVQDFARAHEVYLMLRDGPFSAHENWADYSWYQLYYARFPAWLPFFVITRAVYDIFGVGVRYMIALNYLLYMAGAAVFYAAAKRVFSFRVAFAATAVFVFNPNLIVWAGITSPDHFFIFLFCCMFYFVVRYYTGEGGGKGWRGYKFLALMAVFAALTDFFKPIGVMFLIAFFCVEIFVKIILKGKGIKLPQVIKENYRKWLVFPLVFLAVFFAGHGLVRMETRRVFHVDTVSSTGKFMVFAWATDDGGNYSHDIAFAKFDRLMEEHGHNLPVVLDEMSRYAGEIFRDANHLSVLRQKARLTFGDEGVLGWALHSYDEGRTAAAARVLEHPLWVGFTAHIFVIMALAGLGAVYAIFEKKNRAVIVFLLTTVIGYTLVLLLGIAQARYRLLLYPQLSILAAQGLFGLVKTARARFLKGTLKCS